jgi:hypothetical protein
VLSLFTILNITWLHDGWKQTTNFLLICCPSSRKIPFSLNKEECVRSF